MIWAPDLWRPKNTFQFFFIPLHFNKYIEVAVIDFTMHLIILNGLEDINKCFISILRLYIVYMQLHQSFVSLLNDTES